METIAWNMVARLPVAHEPGNNKDIFFSIQDVHLRKFGRKILVISPSIHQNQMRKFLAHTLWLLRWNLACRLYCCCLHCLESEEIQRLIQNQASQQYSVKWSLNQLYMQAIWYFKKFSNFLPSFHNFFFRIFF